MEGGKPVATLPGSPPSPLPPAPGPTSTRERGIGRRLTRRQYSVLVTASVALLVIGVVLAVGIGVVEVPPWVATRIVLYHLWPAAVHKNWTPLQEQIIWTFRMPRVLLAVVVGAGLSLVGAVLQTMVRNPLADPYLLGVSGGASFAAVLVLVLGSAALGGVSLSGAAFLGALISTAMVYSLAQRNGRINPARLVLAGVALAYLFQAGYSYLLLKTDTIDGVQSILFWLLGSLAGANWSQLRVPAAALMLGIVVLLLQARALNALLSGEETAASLGVNVRRFQIEMLVVTSLLTGVMVAVSGAIAFVGLIIPHVARLIVGADHRRLLPISALCGAAFLVLVDLAARTIDSPNEVPLTIVTALFGVPFFLWLLRRRHTSATESIG